MTGTVEVDETYVGGKAARQTGPWRGWQDHCCGSPGTWRQRSPVVVERTDAETAENLVELAADKSAKIMTDEYGCVQRPDKAGYDHDTVNHGGQEHVDEGDVHTQNIEGFWSQMKRSIDGTHHHVSKKHLQNYADEYAFRFNRRHSVMPMFSHLISALNEQPAS